MPCSAKVGTSGSAGMRAFAAIARIFTLPDAEVITAEEAESNMYCTRPPIRSFAASEPPL
jgi:hypothetical protein